MQQITLYYQLGASDKIYQAGIAPKDGGYVVHFAFGRRGSTLQTGVKNQIPVPYKEASRVYDRIVSEKLARGYRRRKINPFNTPELRLELDITVTEDGLVKVKNCSYFNETVALKLSSVYRKV